MLVLAAVSLLSISFWVFQNRAKLVAACLNTINGVTSKVAHLNEPFGMGASVVSRNPIVGIVPEFELTERSGRTVKKSDLLGSYWVASFIFTRCSTSCPMATAELATLQTQLPREVRLVSFSVDPEHDSPEVLSDYADRVGADTDRWLFLTGEKDDVYRYIREGFHLAVEENRDATPGLEVMHSPRFALVDPKGRIRGYYESNDREELDRLRSDIARLLRRGEAKES
ncbi:MAG: SCO family protein [Candidatus Krumholzibacteriota bacterium]|nr:SCO family protein [Candidatus Krumholzibacteriota bacterium]